MSKLRSLTIPDKYKVEAHAILDEVREREPDTVIVLAFYHGTGLFSVHHSAVKDRLTLVGALEEAKHQLLSKGEVK